jgi:VIT1/CCC1 family predicted Fe2+/Mn2+ transporter
MARQAFAVSVGETQPAPERPALEALVVAERDRVARVARVRELALVAQDALFLSVAVVTGLASADVTKTAIVVAGLAGAVAGGLSQATEARLAARAGDELYDTEVAKELAEIAASQLVEVDELSILLEDEGLSSGAAAAAATRIASSPHSLAKTKVEKELGLTYREDPAPRRASLVGGLIYALLALVPLWPYLLWDPSVALAVSLTAAGVAVVALAVIKARVAHVSLARNAAEAAMCAAAATAGYVVGWLGEAWVG